MSPSASVAESVAWFPVALSAIVATVPADVLQVGDVSTLINPVAELPANPLAETNLTL